MDKNKINTIIFILIAIAIILVTAILMVVKHTQLTKPTISNENMNDKDVLPTIETREPMETEEPLETPEASPIATETPKPKTISSKYYIKVNNTMNTVTIYTKDENGNYTVPVKAMVCSTGEVTPKNSKYQLKSRWPWRRLFGEVNGQYATHIVDDILFHSVPYLEQDKSTLEYWEYDKLGTTASAGCIRLTVQDAKWIYDNCPRGTWVEFYSSSDPGPLGKPSAMKISEYVEYRDWDPTDPSKDNPWRNFNNPTPTIEPTESPTVDPSATPLVTPDTKTPEPTMEPETPTSTPSIEPTVDVPTVTPNII